ncbi:SCO family protein [Natrinema sp. 74]|uniref:SCO family protein n=1 Tax=Natrinema sp. 74 TaxID=3384159 RepID=UPI0038D510C6
MRKRTLLASLGSGVTLGLSGCMGTFGDTSGDGASGNTYLDAKTWSVDPANLPFPTHGDELPSATLPAPVRDRDNVSVPGDFETDLLLTFMYTTCSTMCPRLTAIMAQVQDDALEEEYGEQVSFVEMTFDPARDDADAFASGPTHTTSTWMPTTGTSCVPKARRAPRRLFRTATV